MSNRAAFIGITLAMLLPGSVWAAAALKKEPPMGALKEGQVVMVDDGSCPSGQIKRVIGGNHTKVGGTKNIVRERSCVPR
jgi:hypothetical protein